MRWFSGSIVLQLGSHSRDAKDRHPEKVDQAALNSF